MHIFKTHDTLAKLLSRKMSPISIGVGETWSYVSAEEMNHQWVQRKIEEVSSFAEGVESGT